MSSDIYSEVKKIFDIKIASCYIYHMRAGKVEEKHYHKALEVEYIISGSCKTHKKGRLYIYRVGQIHEVINDSNKELVFICLTIPAESKANTFYI